MKHIYLEQIVLLQQALQKYPTIASKMLCAVVLVDMHKKGVVVQDSLTIEYLNNGEEFFLHISQNDIMKLLVDATHTINAGQNDAVVIEDAVVLPSDFEQVAEHIAKQAPKNDKMAWWRLDRQMRSLLQQLEELNEKFFEYQQKLNESSSKLRHEFLNIITEREHVLEHIDTMREKMVAECIHASNNISWNSEGYVCKFCNTKINVVK